MNILLRRRARRLPIPALLCVAACWALGTGAALGQFRQTSAASHAADSHSIMASYAGVATRGDLSKADRRYRAHQTRFHSFDDPWACVDGVAAARRDATARIAPPRSREKAPTIQRFPQM